MTDKHRLLPRFFRRQQEAEDAEKAARRLLDSGEQAPPDLQRVYGATLPGDARRKRGIPVAGGGGSGTSPGTDPLLELLRKERSEREERRIKRNPKLRSSG